MNASIETSSCTTLRYTIFMCQRTSLNATKERGGHIGLRVGPNPMTGVLVKETRGRFGYRDTEGRRPCEDRGRDWGDAATSQGTPGGPQSGKRQEGSSPGALEREQPCRRLGFRLVASREPISAVLSPWFAVICCGGHEEQTQNVDSSRAWAAFSVTESHAWHTAGAHEVFGKGDCVSGDVNLRPGRGGIFVLSDTGTGSQC